jgi:putative transcriptional regulator
MCEMSVPTFRVHKVKPLREFLGFTQTEFAEQLGVTQGLVAMWESGQRIPRGPAAILLSQMQARVELEEKVPIPA